MKNEKNKQIESNATSIELAQTHVTQDLKNSVLIVSVVVNLVVFTAWVMLQVTTQFDAQFANLLFNR